MRPRRHFRLRARRAARFLAATFFAALTCIVSAFFTAHAATPRVHAIVGARIVAAPGQVIERGTIVMRDGVIVAVGARVAVPADARIWRGDSLTIYPGLIDPYVVPKEERRERRESGEGGGGFVFPRAAERRIEGAGHALAAVTPEASALEKLPLPAPQVDSLRAAGFTVVQVVPSDGILRGSSAVIGLGSGVPADDVLRPRAAQVIALETARGTYPGSLMGVIATIRQGLMDARWYQDVHDRYARFPAGKERPETNRAWEALRPVIMGNQPALFVASDMLEVLHASAIAHEAGIQAQVVGAGDEYKRAREIAAGGLPVFVPVDYPKAPDVADPGLTPEVSTETLRHWNRAPENAAALKKAGVTFAFTAHGLDAVAGYRAGVGKAVERGLDEPSALAAMTTVPARLLGLADKLGTLAPGKIANLTVTRGDLFGGGVHEVWVDGNRYEIRERRAGGMKGTWSLVWGDRQAGLVVAVERDTSVKFVVGADTLVATDVRFEGERLRFAVMTSDGSPEGFDLTAEHDRALGQTARGIQVVAVRKAAERRGTKKEPTAPVETPVVMGNSEAWRAKKPDAPRLVMVKNATIWTAGPQGTIENADMVVRSGKIAAVGKGLATPAGATVIDGAGKHVWPGIIDAHSHAAILGGVNECTNNVTAEVRIGDVINSENINIYRHLAGGTTIAHLLHGSCNSIGGQSAVIKARWGEAPDGLAFQAAPPTIKFALGENPKRANSNSPSARQRYPQTRGGVEQSIRDAFSAARDYGLAMQEFRSGKRPLPPRRDLQKEAVLEILEGKRFIHSHSYRQDEILMLMRVAEEFGITVQCFQHVLEGYKVADEMAAHGAGGSTFSDWWAYKFEVIDAVPYNGYLMWDRGVLTSFNSDNSQLARTLNLEAAKAVKYGGVPSEQAIQFVTLNPAKQLKIADRVGSLEVGKDADFAVWNGSPLSPLSRCEETWIEGHKYFDRTEDLAGRAALEAERAALLAKARAEGESGGGGAMHARRFGYLEETDLSGNDCGGIEAPFLSESERRALRGEVER